MHNNYLPLDEKPEKGFVLTLMVVFGILCLITSAWWAVYLIKSPGQQGSFWVATVFIFLFGIYQVYAGLGFARRYIRIEGDTIRIRQNSFLPAVEFVSGSISTITIRSADVVFKYEPDKSFKLRLGIRYPNLGENIKSEIISYAENNKVEVLYKYDISE